MTDAQQREAARQFLYRWKDKANSSVNIKEDEDARSFWIELLSDVFGMENVTQRAAIEATVQGILDARSLYPDSGLADLYDPLAMPPELRKAHAKNDAAVMKAYGMPIKETDEAACVAWLMRLYQEKISEA